MLFLQSLQIRNLGLPEWNQALWTSLLVLKSMCFIPVAFKLQPAPESPGELTETHILGFCPGFPRGLGIDISDKFPGDVSAAVPRPTLWEALLCTPQAPFLSAGSWESFHWHAGKWGKSCTGVFRNPNVLNGEDYPFFLEVVSFLFCNDKCFFLRETTVMISVVWMSRPCPKMKSWQLWPSSWFLGTFPGSPEPRSLTAVASSMWSLVPSF